MENIYSSICKGNIIFLIKYFNLAQSFGYYKIKYFISILPKSAKNIKIIKPSVLPNKECHFPNNGSFIFRFDEARTPYIGNEPMTEG